VRQLETKFEPLRHYPEIGPRRDQLAPGLRTHFYRDYVIYYQFTEIELIIVRVVHGSRDAVALFSAG